MLRTLRAVIVVACGMASVIPEAVAQKKMTKEELKEFQRGVQEGFQEARAEQRAIARKLHQMREDGLALAKKGDMQASTALYRQALDLAIKSFGEDHRETSVARYFLTFRLFDTGNDEEYATIILQLLDFWKRHPETLGELKKGMFTKLMHCGTLDLPREKHEALLEALPQASRVLGPSGDLGAEVARGRYFVKQGEPVKAVAAYRKALATQSTMHMASAKARSELADALIRAGQSPEGIAEAEVVIKWLRETFGADHALTQSWRSNYGIILQRAGKSAEALPELEAGIRAAEAIFIGEDATVLIHARFALAHTLRAIGRTDDAEKAIAKVREALAGYHRRKTFDLLELEKWVQEWPGPKALPGK
jgi:tetratricopeptide (TPR) repeat protein